MSEKKLRRLVAREDFQTNPTWWVAEEYAIEKVQPEYGGRIEMVVVKRVGRNVTSYFPLTDPDLFSSFARLGRDEYVSDRAILSWVGKHGLLEKMDEGEPPSFIGPVDEEANELWDRYPYGPPEGALEKRPRTPGTRGREPATGLNQSRMPVEDFKAEVDNAHGASLLYSYLADGGVEGVKSLKGRIVELREQQRTKSRTLSGIDRELVARCGDRVDESATMYRKDDYVLWDAATRTLELHVRKKIRRVNIDLASKGYSLYGVPPSPIAYAQSFSCPDLLSAMYLQFYFFMTGALPRRVCANKNCRTIFELTRKDRVYCSTGCRSSGRPSRRSRGR